MCGGAPPKRLPTHTGASAQGDEIKALMRMAGVPESRMADPAMALRAIEQRRRKVLEEGGGGARCVP